VHLHTREAVAVSALEDGEGLVADLGHCNLQCCAKPSANAWVSMNDLDVPQNLYNVSVAAGAKEERLWH